MTIQEGVWLFGNIFVPFTFWLGYVIIDGMDEDHARMHMKVLAPVTMTLFNLINVTLFLFR